MQNKTVHMVTFALLAVGGLNWLLIGLLNFNLVMYIGTMVGGSMLEKVVYILVGLSAVYEIVIHKANCKMCSGGTQM